MAEFTPEKCKQIALARLDIVYKWLEFRNQSQNKLKADYDFVKLHNTSNSHLFEILGKISPGSLHRWYGMLNETEDYTKFLPQYKYSSVDDYRTVLNDEEIKIFMGLLLHPNRLSIGKAIALTKYKLKEQGQNFIPADITFRRYVKWFKDNNYDKWILARDGEKALSDKVEPYIKRDASLLEVGDILVADGHKLAFQVITPFTEKGCRATLVGFLDWKSTALVGYEIMLDENTQGSGKSLTMVMLAKAISLEPEIVNPKVIIVTDRIDLDKQISDTFKSCGKVVKKATSGEDLGNIIADNKETIITTVINKFQAALRKKKVIDNSKNVFVLVDESHRSQYGKLI